jgi:hypothetical protein
MQSSSNEFNLPPCIVDRGVIFNKRDIFRILQALDYVEYSEFIEGKQTFSREGFIVEIFEDETEASLFFNRRIHINVNSLEYLKINYNFESLEEKKSYEIELCLGTNKKVILKPLNEPLDNKEELMQEAVERRKALNSWEDFVMVDTEED